MDTYEFRREDNGEVVSVDFETMMGMDPLGCITLPDGVVARRVRHEQRRSKAERELEKPMISDSLGFTEAQLGEFEAHRRMHGFTGIEFKRDPLEPTFFQVHCSGKKEFARYRKSRGYCEKNSRNGGGQAVSARDLALAEKRMRELYPD